MNIEKERLLKRLGYKFRDPALFELALSHRSVGAKNNERLEFLGDSLLNCIIAEALYHQFPKSKEGQLSRLRSQLVKGVTLASVAKDFELGACLNLGAGELKSGGYRRESILADTVEALIAAIYLDGGIEVCCERVLKWFKTRLSDATLESTQKDAKTRLQEFLQSRKAALPLYVIKNVIGEAHAQTFIIECQVSMLKNSTLGEGVSRREAEQAAASQALQALKVDI